MSSASNPSTFFLSPILFVEPSFVYNFLTPDLKLADCFDSLRSAYWVWLTKHSHAGEVLRKHYMPTASGNF